ncbi:PREDICTED: CWF19-like protein 2 [Rhagoletis zephyria]|uniref:CWF19-like protein 2 n=1 Tax=Rhagoletis zephyria TaxID=28612 RepID=UPI0008113C25|nr:PREDICTED: CWF19-like protein 2 [Rhagoletis zephyria]
MGKHKEKKEKKKSSKKHKKEKRHRHDSSGDESGEGEVVWAEAGAEVPSTSTTGSKSADIKPPEKQTTSAKVSKDESDDEVEEEEVGGGENDWLGFIETKSKGNVKLAHLKRDILKREQATADNKVRYARELNSYFRDDTTKKFIEDPEAYWQAKASKSSKALETDSESDGEDDKEYASDDDDEEDRKPTKPAAKKLSDNERNAINAQLAKAEMLGKRELVAELKAKLKESAEAPEDSAHEEEVHYTKRKAKPTVAEEEAMTVKEMYLSTKSSISSRGEAARFVASSSKLRPKYDDEYEEVKGKGKKKLKVHHDQFERMQSKNSSSSSEPCQDCLERLGKHLALRFAPENLRHLFVAFTPTEPFTPNYCQIRSRSHSTANNSVEADDEDLWRELRQVMRQLTAFFDRHLGCATLFMETHFVAAKRAQNASRRHLVIEVVPLKKKYEADARIYFNKAILETGEEWATNRKLIKLEGRPVTKVIPRGLGYFWVAFGGDFQGGFAHVIEDEDYFSRDFGKEVIGGLRDIEPSRWKRPRHEDYDRQMRRVAEVKEKWSEFMQEHS